MKRHLFLILLLAAVPAAAQPWDGNYPPVTEYAAAHRELYAGNYRTYPFDEVSPAPLPKRYKPVYISHYGRHGSRFYTSEKGYALIWRMFSDAQDAGALTEEGRAFWDVFRPLYESEIKGHAGELTTIGEREQALLAAAMVRRYPEVFATGARIDARSTTKPRVIASMKAFCTTLRTLRPTLAVNTSANEADMPVLNCIVPGNPSVKPFDLRNLDLKGLWKEDYLALRSAMDTVSFFRRMFTDFNVKAYGDKRDIVQIFYNVCADGPCIAPGFQGLRWLSDEELYPIWRFTNLKFYAIAGPSEKYSFGRAPALMAPLLEDIISLADSDLQGGCAARLRFGHDYQIVSLLSLLGAEPWVRTLDDPYEVESVFRYNNIPMASNLQLVFWQGKRPDDILVRVLFNDADLPLPVRRVRGAYYRWADLRAYFELRLDKAHKLLKDTESLL